MKYKSLFFILLIISVFKINSHAQVGVGSIELVTKKAGDIAPEDLEALKKTKTVFVFAGIDKTEKENWEKVFKEVWTITPVEFIDYDKLNSYLNKPNYSFLTMGGVLTTGMADNLHVYLTLWMNKKNAKSKTEKVTFCRLEIFPSPASAFMLKYTKENETMSYIYKKLIFYNWYPGLQKDGLRNVNDVLLKGDTKWLYGDAVEPEGLSKVQNETLYIPDYVLIDFSGMSANETKKQDEAKLIKDYKGKYQLLTAKELSDKIVAGDSFYYLTFVRSSTDKYVSIYNSSGGQLLYTKYKAVSYKMNNGDFKDLQNAVEGKK